MTTACRLIVDEPAPGVWNMAVDEAILDHTADGPDAGNGPATLRLYRWSEPTLSLGYFQAHADRHGHAASRGLPMVRRSSGGGALVHDAELTYSLALPAGSPHTRDAVGLTCLAHKAIVAAIEELTGDAGRLTTCQSATNFPPADNPFLCFQRRAEGDLLARPGAGADLPATVDGLHKVCGSAQRKRRGAVLQHGGVLLRVSSAAPELPGLAELGVDGVDAARLSEALARNLSARLGLRSEAGVLSEEETRAAERLADEKFGSRGWTERR